MPSNRTRDDDAMSAVGGISMAIDAILKGLTQEELRRRIEAGEPILQETKPKEIEPKGLSDEEVEVALTLRRILIKTLDADRAGEL